MTTTPWVPQRPTLVYGAPGSGKTAAAVESALDFLRGGEDSRRLLVLSPTRTSAARLRDQLEARWGAEAPDEALSEQPSRSFASYAFWILGEARRRGIVSFRARVPRLLSGAEQDSIIREILTELVHRGAVATWPETLREAVSADGFRKEVRELLDRAREYGISPQELHDIAVERGIPEWSAAAEVYARYLERFSSVEYEDAYDPSGLISEAARLLEQNPVLLDAERHRLMRIIVDDLQEATPSVHRLLQLIGAGRPILAFANSDAVTQGFRGARPDMLKAWQQVMAPDPGCALYGEEPELAQMLTGHGMAGGIAGVYARTVQHISAPGKKEFRQMWASTLADQQTVEDRASAHGVTASSEHAAELAVLAEILRRYDVDRVPFSEIAVIARSGNSARRLARVLTAQGVPVRQSMRDVILHQEPAVEPLLRMMALVTVSSGPLEQSVALHDVLTLLDSRYGATDAFRLRRVRQLLRGQERRAAAAEQRTMRDSDELILAAALDPEDPLLNSVARTHSSAARESPAFGLRRIALMLRAGNSAVEHTPQVRPGELLWAIWEASGLAEQWQEATRRPGRDADRADHDLDTVLALFHAAERFEHQNPEAAAADFADHMQRLELPMDTLAESSAAEDAVQVLTPTTASGLHFNTVILTDLQQGVWPNLRQRGALLRSSELADRAQGQTSPESQHPMVRRLQTLQDEHRLFAAAVSRASTRLFAVAVDTQEERPSTLLDLVSPPEDRDDAAEKEIRPLTETALVAELRRTLEQNPEDDDAAEALAALARYGILGASPESWWGLPGPTTAEPLTALDETLHISPSAVGTAIDQPLQWFTGKAGGTEPTDFSRMLGTLIHQIAEAHPTETDPEVLHRELQQHWHTLRLEGWEAEVKKERAQAMLTVLAQYHRSVADREVVGLEAKGQATLEVTVADQQRSVAISGTIDRIESDAHALHLLDLKTGSQPPAQDLTKRNPQLGMYQLLVALDPDLGALGQVEQAQLLYIADRDKPATRDQPAAPVENRDSWPHKQLSEAAGAMSASSFLARHDAKSATGQWSRCRVGPLCPLCDDTKQVTQP